jgi:hypothetical protein
MSCLSYNVPSRDLWDIVTWMYMALATHFLARLMHGSNNTLLATNASSANPKLTHMHACTGVTSKIVPLS